MNTRKMGRKKSRAELYRQLNSPSKNKSSNSELHMTQVQKAIFYSCVGVGIIASWVLQAILGINGMLTTAIISGIGGGVAGLVGIGIVLLMLTPDQKRKHFKSKKR